ncbi:hypothetical protein [Subtercola sp. RTI3]|uniref:hypothetical protein n=1 Tax=Subtercola sp. RTI3 TaxID=3048639 RepID=UPI002B234566|nr:hypothetical protein [Subtercola sp. RTI3]MEA9986271.1 hypothetical protein [Subtercola sp. RTI3]
MNWNQETPAGDLLIMLIAIFGVIAFIAFWIWMGKRLVKSNRRQRKEQIRRMVLQDYQDQIDLQNVAREILEKFGEGEVA